MKSQTELYTAMIQYFTGDPKRIQHFTKVAGYAVLIGTIEKLSEHEMFVLEAAAITHDIGIKVSEVKYGDCTGKHQEQEGPAEAQKMLSRLNYPQDVINRVCWLIAHHHTYSNITEKDHQILVEADFLVNLYEDGEPLPSVKTAYSKIFKTAAGRGICRDMYGIV